MKTTRFFMLYRLMALFLLLWAPLSDAATIIVDSAADPAESGKCTLRQAIENANGQDAINPNCVPGSAGVDDIVFQLTTPATINLTGKLPALKEDVNIINNTGDKLTVRRNTGGDYRIFKVKTGATVTIDGLHITNGKASEGGGIYNLGNLTILNSAIHQNMTTDTSQKDEDGGGIYNLGDLKIAKSTISQNITYEEGGGIYNTSPGVVNIVDSTISGNEADEEGGGISNDNGSITTIVNSTISGNAALSEGGGGGIYNCSGQVDIVNTTISQNQGSIFGGGILDNNSSQFLKLLGVSVKSCSNGKINLKNSIVAGNEAPFGVEIWGNIFGNNDNLVDLNGLTLNQVLDTNLALNGSLAGSPRTHALVCGSPAIDAGNDSLVPATITTDQRGAARIERIVDIGAFELEPPSAYFYDFKQGNFSTAEGDSNQISQVVKVIRTGGNLSIASKVDVLLTGDTATAGTDFVAGPITVPFKPCETQKSVSIELLGDIAVELDETILLSLSNFTPIGQAGTTYPTATLTIVNDDNNNAPILDHSSSITLTDIDENESNSAGDLISTLLQNRVSDLDGDPIGIAVTAIDNNNGIWQHQAHGGTDFIDFPNTIADNQALLLDEAIKIRFVPNLNYVGTAQISFRAWDKTSGTHGNSKADTTKNGDPTAFSVNIATATMTINPIVKEKEPATSEETIEAKPSTEPKKPAESKESVELVPEKLVETEKPEEPIQSEEPATLVPEKSVNMEQPEKPIQSEEPATLVLEKPVDTEQSTQSEEPVELVPDKSVDTEKPIQSEEPVELVPEKKVEETPQPPKTSSSPSYQLEILKPYGGVVKTMTNEYINCSANSTNCTQYYNQGTLVELETVPNNGFLFQEWKGEDCADSFKIKNDMTCKAIFARIPAPKYLSKPGPDSSLEFGESEIGTPITLTIDIQENGIGDLKVMDYSITGEQVLDFSITEPEFPLLIVDGGDAQTLTVQCNPSKAGPRTATLEINSNDIDNPTATYSLVCHGLSPTIVENTQVEPNIESSSDTRSTTEIESVESENSIEPSVVVDENTTTSPNTEETETSVIVDDTIPQNTVKIENPPVIIVQNTTENAVETPIVENEDSTTSQDIIETEEPTVQKENSIETEVSTSVDNITVPEILEIPEAETPLISPEPPETEPTTESEDEVLPKNRTLTITKKGKGTVSGYFESNLGIQDGIHCGSNCTAGYPEGTTVMLIPKPDDNHQFIKWSAGCDKIFTINRDLNCTAHFKPKEYTLTITQTQAATITSSDQGIVCGMDCTESYPIGSVVMLTAKPISDKWLFDRWIGCEDGLAKMFQDQTCTAKFLSDQDGDHIPDHVENGAPFGGDGNGDAKLDQEQLHVTSFIDEQNDSYITVVLDDTKDCAIEDIRTEILETPSGADISTLDFQFTKQCSQADMSVYYHGQQNAFNEAYLEYGDEADNYLSAQGWHNPYGILPETVMIQGQAVTKASLTLLKKEESNNPPVDEGPKDAIHFSERHYYVNENDGIVEIPVIRHGTTAGEVCVNYGAFGYHARLEQDYQILPNNDNQNVLCWKANEAGRKTFTVAIIDNPIQDDKSRELRLSLLSRNEQVELTIEKAIVTIRNDDFPPCATTLTHQNLKGKKCQAGGQTITGDVIIESDPEPGNGTIIIGAIFEDKVIKGNGRLEQATFKAPVINKRGRITDSEFHGPVENHDLGIIADATFENGEVHQHPEALIHNATVGQNVTIHGGRLSGTVNSQGTLVDVKFNGDLLEGGNLQGIIQNNGGGMIKDVNLMASEYSMTSITGGQVAGQITGEKEQPAILQDVTVLAGSHLKNVILGENVQLAVDVTLENVQSLDDSDVQSEDETTQESGNSVLLISPESGEPKNRAAVESQKATDDIIDSLGVCHNALAIDPNSTEPPYQPMDTEACFTTQLKISEQPNYRTRFSYAKAQEQIELSVKIRVDPHDVGQSAEILMVAIHDNLRHPIAYTRDNDIWQVWDGDVTTIPIADSKVLSEGPITIPIYQGHLAQDLSDNLGEFTVYVGYRLQNYGPIIYNGHNLIQLFWGNARSIETKTHDLCEATLNHENDVTSFFATQTGFQTPFGRKNSLDVIRIHVDPEHVGQLANIYMVAISEDHLELYDGETWQNWDCQLNSLKPARSNRKLSENVLEIPFYQGRLRNLSNLMIYVGYRVKDENRIIFRGMTR
jgi:hypothetical protein